jgi:hypothetical protein
MVGWALIRRWYAAVLGLLAVGAVCAAAYGAVPVNYKANGSLVLLPSAQSVGTGGNPYLFLDGLGQAMDVLTRRMAAPDVQSKFTAEYPKMSYTAVPDVTSGSSILVVTVQARSSDAAMQALSAILADVPTELASMQDALKVPGAARISTMPVAEPSAPVPDTKPRIQVVGGVGAAGLFVVVMLTALLDGILLRRARRREAAAQVAARGATERGAAERGAVERGAIDAPEEPDRVSPRLVSVHSPALEPDAEAASEPADREALRRRSRSGML